MPQPITLMVATTELPEVEIFYLLATLNSPDHPLCEYNWNEGWLVFKITEERGFRVTVCGQRIIFSTRDREIVESWVTELDLTVRKRQSFTFQDRDAVWAWIADQRANDMAAKNREDGWNTLQRCLAELAKDARALSNTSPP